MPPSSCSAVDSLFGLPRGRTGPAPGFGGPAQPTSPDFLFGLGGGHSHSQGAAKAGSGLGLGGLGLGERLLQAVIGQEIVEGQQQKTAPRPCPTTSCPWPAC